MDEASRWVSLFPRNAYHNSWHSERIRYRLKAHTLLILQTLQSISHTQSMDHGLVASASINLVEMQNFSLHTRSTK